MIGLRGAVTFLTRLPVGGGGTESMASWFSLVGALIGLAVAGVYAALYPWLPSLLGAVVAVGAGIWLTGAFHEDGLADSFDALGSGASGDEALQIMRDSRLGTYGTSAVVISLLWRVIAVGSLTPTVAVAGVVMAHSLGRAGSVALMALTPPARSDGLGRSGVLAVTARGVWFAILFGIGISLLAGGWWAAASVVVVAVAVIVLRRVSMRRVGGITGDLLGACEQIGEMGVLAIVAGAAWHGWTPWWAVA